MQKFVKSSLIEFLNQEPTSEFQRYWDGNNEEFWEFFSDLYLTTDFCNDWKTTFMNFLSQNFKCVKIFLNTVDTAHIYISTETSFADIKRYALQQISMTEEEFSNAPSHSLKYIIDDMFNWADEDTSYISIHLNKSAINFLKTKMQPFIKSSLIEFINQKPTSEFQRYWDGNDEEFWEFFSDLYLTAEFCDDWKTTFMNSINQYFKCVKILVNSVDSAYIYIAEYTSTSDTIRYALQQISMPEEDLKDLECVIDNLTDWTAEDGSYISITSGEHCQDLDNLKPEIYIEGKEYSDLEEFSEKREDFNIKPDFSWTNLMGIVTN